MEDNWQELSLALAPVFLSAKYHPLAHKEDQLINNSLVNGFLFSLTVLLVSRNWLHGLIWVAWMHHVVGIFWVRHFNFFFLFVGHLGFLHALHIDLLLLDTLLNILMHFLFLVEWPMPTALRCLFRVANHVSLTVKKGMSYHRYHERNKLHVMLRSATLWVSWEALFECKSSEEWFEVVWDCRNSIVKITSLSNHLQLDIKVAINNILESIISQLVTTFDRK